MKGRFSGLRAGVRFGANLWDPQQRSAGFGALRRLTTECLEWILTQEEVPATTPQTCGNYLLHDLPMCKWECAGYLDRLRNDFHSEYTPLQVTLEDGRVFADA